MSMGIKFGIMNTIVIYYILFIFSFSAEDIPCAPRKYGPSSVVCVCNAEYCDEISKIQKLSAGKYVAYTSNKEGLRFVKTTGRFVKNSSVFNMIKNSINAIWNILPFSHKNEGTTTIQIQRHKKYQDIIGFGGTFTDASGINIKSLSKKVQRKLINSYFSKNGLEYNMGRVPIGGNDFSIHPYAYNMEPENDVNLSNFSLSQEDFELKIPLIHEAMAVAVDKLLLISSAWSPPLWMKTNYAFGGKNRLLPKYYQIWADYHLKFLEHYAQQDVPIWAMSTGNEPIDGVIPFIYFNNLGWTPTEQAKWIVNNLGPTIRNSKFADIKLLALDDQRLTLPWWIQLISMVNNTMDYIDGIATHWYWDDFFPQSNIKSTLEMFPEKFLISTEACVGDKFWQIIKVDLGSWSRAESYIKNIIEDLNLYYTGWIDFNLALNLQGGPTWYRNFVDSPIIVIPEHDEFLKQPMFYAMGHFSKFIPRGSVRVFVEILAGNIDNVAFLRPDSGISIIIYNSANNERVLKIKEEEKGYIEIKMPARSIQSIIYW